MPFDQQDFGLPSGRSIEGRASPATDPAASDSTLRALIRLRDYHSDPSKWCNTGLSDETGAVCIAGAMGRVCFAESSEATQYLERALPEAAWVGAEAGLIRFNEHMGTTHAELMALYDRAIALAEADTADRARLSTERPEGTPPLPSLSK